MITNQRNIWFLVIMLLYNLILILIIMRLHSLIRTAQVLVFMLFYVLLSAQEYDSELLTRRIYAQINQVNEYICAMSDKSKNLSIREYYKNKTLSLFYNRGDDYIIPFGSQRKAIKIVYEYGDRNLCRYVNGYFSGLVNFRYSPVQINSINILSSCNIEFDLDTFIASPKSFNLSDLEKFDDNIYILPCKIVNRNQNCQIDADLYLLEENTIDGIELITFITGLKGTMSVKIQNQ